MRVITLSLLAIAPLFANGNNEWLGENYRPYELQLSYFQESQSEKMWRADFLASLANFSEVELTYSDYNAIEGDAGLTAYGVAWNSDPLANWGAGLAFSQRGNESDIEITEGQVSAFHYFSKLKLQLHYKQADIQVYLRDRVIEYFDIADKAEVARNSYGVGLFYPQKDWAWQFHLEFMDYDKDVSRALNSRLFLRAFDDLVLSQLLGLTNWQVAIALQKSFKQTQLAIGLQKYQQLVDKDERLILDSSLSYDLSTTVSAQLGLWYEFEDKSLPVSVSLAWRW